MRGMGTLGVGSVLALICLGGLAGCLGEGSDEGPRPPPVITSPTCASGQSVVGLAGPQCATVEPDGGKACRNSTECRGFCLADTRTCSSVRPYFGCHALYEDGREVMICVD